MFAGQSVEDWKCVGCRVKCEKGTSSTTGSPVPNLLSSATLGEKLKAWKSSDLELAVDGGEGEDTVFADEWSRYVYAAVGQTMLSPWSLVLKRAWFRDDGNV